MRLLRQLAPAVVVAFAGGQAIAAVQGNVPLLACRRGNAVPRRHGAWVGAAATLSR